MLFPYIVGGTFMKNSTNFKNEIDLVFSIERKLGKTKLSSKEVGFLINEASNKVPFPMFCYGYYLYLVERDERTARYWFEKAYKTMDSFFLLYAGVRLVCLGDIFVNDVVRFLKRSAWKKNIVAKHILQYMEKTNYGLNKKT